MRLLHIRNTSLAHVCFANVAIGAISRTILIFSAGVRGQPEWVRKDVVDCDARPWSTVVPTQMQQNLRTHGY